MDEYVTLTRTSHAEYEDRRSVFIGEAAPVSTEEEALAFLESVKKRYPDAKHHVYAYVLREGATRRFSDDREPQGTAGLPVLEAITRRGYTDAVVVVTRYFGGTLLGTGGLVRAYSEAASLALADAHPATRALYARVSFPLTYAEYQRFLPMCAELAFRAEDTVYAEDVTVLGSILAQDRGELERRLSELTGGRSSVKLIEELFSF